MLTADLRIRSGKQKGKLIRLSKGNFLIGRGEDCHLRPNSDLVSRHHCAFRFDGYGVRLKDMGSTNGTFFNGVQVRGNHVLKAGDIVTIGKLEFEVVLKEAPRKALVAAGENNPAVPEVAPEPTIIESDTGANQNMDVDAETVTMTEMPILDPATIESFSHSQEAPKLTTTIRK